MSVLSIEKKQISHLFLSTVLLGLLVLKPAFAVAGNQDKSLVLKQAQLATGRIDRPVRPVKNVILLIPDGCSLATVSAARWYQWLLNPENPALSIDPYLCGTVRTSCSNAPTGDSAPTTSTYMTGELSRAGYVATYPPSDGGNDIFTVDSTRAYQPLMTVLEAAKLLYGKSTGLVFTCEFPHATPADCASHDYSRAKYGNIVSQMVHNRVDVVTGGGCSLLKPEWQDYLKANGYTVQLDDAAGLRTFNGTKLWSLFAPDDMPFDLDRNPAITPSLEEMTTKAIQILSKNKKGFFMMVEGSKVDWAAHANDPVGMITDFLSFDKACKVALDFARKDGNTAVIILPDHGNSGISIGTSRQPHYGDNTKEQIFGNVLKMKRTAAGLAEMLNHCSFTDVRDTIRKYTPLELTDEQLTLLTTCRDYAKSPVAYEQRKAGPYLSYTLAKFMTLSSGFDFTTNGHTAEEVFLANYHPKGDVLNGVRFNFEVNDYLCKLLKLEGKLPELTATYFAKHTDVFKGFACKIKPDDANHFAELTVVHGANKLVLTQNSSVATLNGRDMQLSTVVVYVDKNKTFYLPASLADLLK
jgi:alkaline phosphatase